MVKIDALKVGDRVVEAKSRLKPFAGKVTSLPNGHPNNFIIIELDEEVQHYPSTRGFAPSGKRTIAVWPETICLESEVKYRCKSCGSASVRVAAWVDPNAGNKYDELYFDCFDTLPKKCLDCGENGVELISTTDET